MEIPYVSIHYLNRHILYKIVAIEETNHAYYGIGQRATVCCFEGTTYRIQLPRKYLSRMGPEYLAVLKSDVVEGRNPYFIFREKLLDNSYRLDIVEKCPANDYLYENGAEVPEL